MFGKFVVIIICIIIASTLSYSKNEIEDKSEFHKKIITRLEMIISKEYSIQKLDDIWIGIVNYPQWFVSLSMGEYYGLTFNGLIKGSESLYPTNITHERWMYNFNNNSAQLISTCKNSISGWAKEDKQLEVVLYSQMMNICLSSNYDNYPDDLIWYESCWAKYHRNCKRKG